MYFRVIKLAPLQSCLVILHVFGIVAVCCAVFHAVLYSTLFFSRIFISCFLLLYLVCIVLNINCNFRFGFFLLICFVVAPDFLLICCSLLFLILIYDGLKNVPGNSSVPVERYDVW